MSDENADIYVHIEKQQLRWEIFNVNVRNLLDNGDYSSTCRSIWKL
ncbi:hypothetical protein [uncultured Methanobrevibacter sp.]|nr:hypothetical protein [uncultured Methanobrevibacter sp.]